MFGWCADDIHDSCIEKYQRFYIGPVGQGRKKTQGIIWMDEYNECNCKCHGKTPVKKTTPKRKRKR